MVLEISVIALVLHLGKNVLQLCSNFTSGGAEQRFYVSYSHSQS